MKRALASIGLLFGLGDGLRECRPVENVPQHGGGGNGTGATDG